ncbi:MAG: hypothetical protein M3Y87_37445, partial [Myxococcota bacterium]|nr:hypothetical protein [Myxococcota bacterium]
LEVEPAAPRDAGSVGIDARIDTLPCRWTAGRALAFAFTGDRERPIDDVAAAASAMRELVAVRPRRDDGWADPISEIVLADPPLLRAEVATEREPALRNRFSFARRDGWLEVVSETTACEVRWLGVAHELERAERIAEVACRAHALGRDEIAVTTIRDLFAIGDESGSTARRLATLPLTAADVAVARGRDRTIIAAWLDAPTGALSALAIREDGSTVSAAGLRERVDATPALASDRLIAGAVAIVRAADRASLDRVWLDGDVIRIATIVDLTELAPRIADDVMLVTNETEAIFPLVDGTIVYIPLNGAGVRTIAPPPERGRDHRIVLAEGSSFGGQLWRADDPRGPLFFRTLVCNR